MAQVGLNNFTYETPSSFCQPGVVHKAPSKGASFTYTFNPDFRMMPPDAENPSKVQRNERFDAKIKVPVFIRPKNKFMLGLGYAIERFHFTDINPDNYPLFKRLNEKDLRTANLAMYYTRSINHKYYFGLRLSASYQGDYSKFINFSSKYSIYRATTIFGVKNRPDLEYGIGVNFTKGFRRNSVVPFAFYNHTFNDHWGIETVLPVSIKGRYNFSDRTLVTFGPEFSSQNYALNVFEPSLNPISGELEKAAYQYHRSTLNATFSFFQQLSGWTWIELKGGYVFNMNSEAKDLPEKNTFDLRPSGSMIGVVSFFISPPKSCKTE